MVGADSLTNAMSLNTATFTGSRILGSAIAGAMIAGFGYGPVFLVNGLIFILIGLQLREIVAELEDRPVGELIGQAVLICLTVIVVRITGRSKWPAV